MFKNEVTKEMPCWDCVKMDPGCPILSDIDIPVRASNHLKGLTFECDELQQPKCNNCGAAVSPLETEFDECLACCEEEEE